MSRATDTLDRALGVMWEQPKSLPQEPAAVRLLDHEATIRFLQTRVRMRRRNGWPAVERVCRCGRVYPATLGARLCPSCANKK